MSYNLPSPDFFSLSDKEIAVMIENQQLNRKIAELKKIEICTRDAILADKIKERNAWTNNLYMYMYYYMA